MLMLNAVKGEQYSKQRPRPTYRALLDWPSYRRTVRTTLQNNKTSEFHEHQSNEQIMPYDCHQGMEAAGSSETSVHVYQTT
jgi:hypothetical protein